MSWFFCVMSPKPFLDWEMEKFLNVHPFTKNSIVRPMFYFTFDCRTDMLMRKKPTDEDMSYRIVMGKGYLSKNTGYSQADVNDWEKLLGLEYVPKDIDGHYVAIKLRDNFIQVTNDTFGHCPVYYAKVDDYIIVSSSQQFIAPLLYKKTWNYGAVSALALLPAPLERQSYLKNIHLLGAGATLTVRNGKIKVANRPLSFLTEEDSNIQKYFFSLKKAYELHLEENDFLSLPFENCYSSRFGVAVWSNKSKNDWGLYYKKKSDYYPEKYLEYSATKDLAIFTIPDFKDGDDVFRLYTEYVLKTGLSDFPEFFSLAGRFKAEKKQHEITVFSPMSEWLFETEPLKKVEKMFDIMKEEAFFNFKNNYLLNNYCFKRDFYSLLQKGIKQHFKEAVESIVFSKSLYDEYHFFMQSYNINIQAPQLAWLNDFRTFYSPGMLYSMSCKHIQQRLINKNIALQTNELRESFATEHLLYPKLKDNKFTFPLVPNHNKRYFPLIEGAIGELVEKSEECIYYNFSKLMKLYKKACTGNDKAIDNILKWTAFEIWREFLD